MNQPAEDEREMRVGPGGAVVDIALVSGISGAAFIAELWARDAGLLPLGPDTTGIFAVLAGVLASLALVLLRGQKLAEIGFKPPRRWWTMPLWAVGILAAYVVAQAAIPLLLSGFVELPSLDLSRYDNLYGNLSATLFWMMVVPFTAAIPEEIIYRGFLMDRLSRILGTGALGWTLVVLAQGLLFGLAHFQWGLGGVVFTSVMGVIWGTAFLICGRNLWIVIAAHALGDMLLVVQLYFIKGSELATG